MIDWPSTLVREITKERCIFFLGAGVSASASNTSGTKPPSWNTFLKLACGLVVDQNLQSAITQLVSERKFLIALQAIKENVDRASYLNLLNQTFNVQYQPSRLHEIIYDLDAKVVITTNFDKIYEGYCLSYRSEGVALHKVIDYKSDVLADELRDDTRLLIRAHGSINNTRDMIFTRAEYHKAKRENVSFYEVMKALFLTNTLLFIGCSLEDPDVLLLLEDVHILGRHEKPHYALIKSNEVNSIIMDDWRKTYNIQVFNYGPDYTDLIPHMETLLDLVNSERASYNSMK